jgi:hypothetical protein
MIIAQQFTAGDRCSGSESVERTTEVFSRVSNLILPFHGLAVFVPKSLQ